jgi:tRNA modification GTPase
MRTDDVIIAVSSPPGRSPRGLLRLSGPSLDLSFLSPTPTPRQLTPTRLRFTTGGSLPLLALYHPAPHSFTTQDTLELQLPGNPALLDRVLHLLLDHFRKCRGFRGSRIAEPGEFTQRAFLAGRLDLTRAEGIAATIGAVSDAQLQAAALLRTGRLGAWATDLVDRLARLLALLEAGIDFVDQDDVVAITPADLDAGLADLERQLQQLLTRSRSWSALEAIPWVVLVGEPNVGKSSLFNALLGHTRAVTSPLAGTTRDILTEPLRLQLGPTSGGGAEVMLVDVAGIDATSGGLNPAMQQQAHAAIARAELILLLHDSPGEPATALPPHTAPVIRVQTKSDLFCGTNPLAITVSAHTGSGLDTLRRAIAQRLRDRAVTVAGEMLALQPRHHAQLQSALADLVEARQLLAATSGGGAELIAGRMRTALDHLASLGGVMTPDDVIGKVFATFCIGK